MRFFFFSSNRNETLFIFYDLLFLFQRCVFKIYLYCWCRCSFIPTASVFLCVTVSPFILLLMDVRYVSGVEQ